jgi:hypothetical protein
MTTSIYKKENVIKSESYCLDALTEPLIDFRVFNPATERESLNMWQDHFRQQRIPFAIVKSKSDRWTLWKHLNVAYIHHSERNKGVFGKKQKARCPKCDKNHKQVLDWAGRGTPRTFCPMCAQTMHRYISGIDDAQLNTRAFFGAARS